MVTTSVKLTDSQKLLGWNPISSTNSKKGDSFFPNREGRDSLRPR
jgi:hypothetical protein